MSETNPHFKKNQTVLELLNSHGLDISGVIDSPRKALEKIGKDLPPDLLHYCIRECPLGALEYVKSEMSPESLEAVMDKVFNITDLIPHLDVISQKRIQRAVVQQPGTLLLMPELTDLLSEEQFNHIILTYPKMAMREVGHRLSEKQFDKCLRKSPNAAMEYLPQRINPTQLTHCLKTHKIQVLEYMADLIDQETLLDTIEKLGHETIRNHILNNPDGKLQRRLAGMFGKIRHLHDEILSVVLDLATKSV